uniref:Collagen repeat-containing protein n=1 Tax=Borely moumouvirus TaxID=2712067 RepID=A0A6G6AAT9_9VIRU
MHNSDNSYNSPFAYCPFDNTFIQQEDFIPDIRTVPAVNNLNATINSIRSMNNFGENMCTRQSEIIIGLGIPNNNCGNNGDIYIDSTTNNYYVKNNCVWILRGNLTRNICQNEKGEKGAIGDKGEKGLKGDIGDKGLKGDKGEILSENNSYINSFIQYSPGNFSSIVPSGATVAYISAVGGGAGGSMSSTTINSYGGGGGGGVIKYPVSVSSGQIINGVIGTGGNGGTIKLPPIKGSDTVINIGTLSLIIGGGNIATSSNGGDGGSVYTPMVAVIGGQGGTENSPIGKNGTINFFFYGGAGGGYPGNNGGDILGFIGGQSINCSESAGGGGASAFANGGSPNSHFNIININGTLGSGGAGAIGNNTLKSAGNGGNGFIRIDYYTH